jgi:soluble lytic murein transglycosylase-like protein
MELSTRFKAVRHLIREAASQHGVEFELLQAVIATESGFDPEAVSPKGAVGLMQLIPDTAERFGVRPQGALSVSERLTDPRTNIQAGSRYLAWLIKHFNGDVRLALAGYNAGEGAVLKAGRRIPNYPETISYVQKVTELHGSLKLPRTVSQSRPEPAPSLMPVRPPGRG